MESKDIIGLCLLLVATLGGIAVTCLSWRARDVAFFLLVAGTVITQKLDINFLSHYWYRGTTRGLEISFVDILGVSLLCSGFLFPRPGESRWYWPASLGWLLLFLLYSAFSVVMSEPRINGIFELSKMVRGVIFFLAAALYVRSERELSILMLALGAAMCFEGALAAKQRLLDGMHRVNGSLEHPNSFSMYLCLVGPVFVAAANSTLPRLVRYLSAVAIAATTLCMVLTISRAGVPIFALIMLGVTALCVSWRITFRKIAMSALIVVALAALLARSWDTLTDRFKEATFEEEYLDENLEGRGFYLRLAWAIMSDRPFGVGLNNWSHWVSKRYGPQIGTPYEDYDSLTSLPGRDEVEELNHAAPAHNLGALVVGELGVPGLLLFGLLWVRWLQMGLVFVRHRNPVATQQLAIGILFGLGGVLLQSATEWTFRQTHIFVTCHVLVGVLASLYHLRRQSRLHRAPLLQPTAAGPWRAEAGEALQPVRG